MQEKVRPGTGREAGLGHAPVSRICTWMYTDRGAHDYRDVEGRATQGAVAEDVRERSEWMAASDLFTAIRGLVQ